jgi:hypothetical protein
LLFLHLQFSLAILLLVLFSSCSVHSSTTTTTPSSSVLAPIRTLLRLQIIHVFNINPLLSFCRFSCGGETIQSGRCFHISGFSYASYASRLFNRFGGC